MAYKVTEACETPPDCTVIWRYMNLARFNDLLSSQSLFFTRITCFEDPWEGALPPSHFNRDFLRQNYFPGGIGAMEEAAINIAMKFSPAHAKQIARGFAANCWHMNKIESDALWKQYAGRESGIAIQSTAGNLKESVAAYPRRDVFVGSVRYMDYHHQRLEPGSGWAAITKRKEFEHERELRALISSLSRSINPLDVHEVNPFDLPNGERVAVDLRCLIRSVVISPFADKSLLAAAERSIEVAKLNVPCTQSQLMTPPKYRLDSPS